MNIRKQDEKMLLAIIRTILNNNESETMTEIFVALIVCWTTREREGVLLAAVLFCNCS